MSTHICYDHGYYAPPNDDRECPFCRLIEVEARIAELEGREITPAVIERGVQVLRRPVYLYDFAIGRHELVVREIIRAALREIE